MNGRNGIPGRHWTGIRSVPRSPIVRMMTTGLAVALLLVGPPPGPPGAAADDGPTNLLDGPFADVAILRRVELETTPDLLVLRASDGTSGTARLSILRRTSSWQEESTTEVDVGDSDLRDRWLADLGAGRYALIASSHDEPHRGSAVVVILQVREGPTALIEQIARQTFDRAIDSSGAADVDGFGSPELVLGMRPVFEPNGICGTTAIDVVDAATALVRRAIDLPPTIGLGALGRFDDVPGDDLLLYLAPGCPPGGTAHSSLVAVNLGDGRQKSMAPGNHHEDPSSIPAPVRIDVDGKAPDEALVTVQNGLAVIDPQGGSSLVLGDYLPLLVAASGSQSAGSRIALLDPVGRRLVVGELRRDRATLRFEQRSVLSADEMIGDRWQILDAMTRAAAAIGDPAGAWSGDVLSPGCPDLLLHGAILACGDDLLRPSAAWLATRPIGALPMDDQLMMVVASGLAWDRRLGPPRSPTPVAAGPDGWWRRGPSTPFSLSEAPVGELFDLQQFPTPTATIESTPTADGTALVSGLRGSRLFTSIVPLAAGQDPAAPADDLVEALSQTSDRATTDVDTVIRLPVPAGLVAGRDGVSTRVDLGAIKPEAEAAAKWSVQVVPINDWGEWGQPVTSVIEGDVVGPKIVVEDPFLSPIWPMSTRLGGHTEAGSTVRIDGSSPMAVDERGGFTVERPLAPWPQTIRVEATDLAGNTSAATFTVIGGIDYRRLPWPGIVTGVLLSSIAIRGLFGGRREPKGVEVKPRSTGLDDPAMPEIEELPPGSGLARG